MLMTHASLQEGPLRCRDVTLASTLTVDLDVDVDFEVHLHLKDGPLRFHRRAANLHAEDRFLDDGLDLHCGGSCID